MKMPNPLKTIKDKLKSIRKYEEKEFSKLEKLEIWLDGFVWTSVIVLTVSIIIFGVWWFYYSSQPKVISGINYFRFPVVVSIEDSHYSLNQFETFSHTTQEIEAATLTVTDQDGVKIQEYDLELTTTRSTAVAILSAEADLEMCPVLLDVTEMFYPVKNKSNREAYLLAKLGDPINKDLYTYVTHADHPRAFATLNPATYNGENLPESLAAHQRINGIYFIECENLESTEAITKEAMWWSDYSSDEQLRLYNQAQETLEETPEYKL